MFTIDCHVLLQPDRGRFSASCLGSLSGEPVNVHTMVGVRGHIGCGRMAGFALGGAPYVSFVDDDDAVIPGSFQACLTALESDPNAIGAFPDEIIIDEDGNTIGPGISTGSDWSINRQITLMPFVHHGVVMRRDAVTPLLPYLANWPTFPEQILFGLLAITGRWIHIPQPGYQWRVHPGQASVGKRGEAEEVIRFLAGRILGDNDNGSSN